MTIKQLKSSLAKLGFDYDDAIIYLLTMDENNKRKYTPLCSTGLIKNKNAIFLGDYEASQDLLDTNTQTLDDWLKDLEDGKE